jgi:hypothetical protein
VAAGHGVDHDEVVVVLLDLVAELADGQDLLHARRGVGDEVERPGQRADLGQQRELELEAQVLLQRLLGVHGHGPEAGLDLAGIERGRPGLVEVGQVALGVDLAHERALAARRGEQPEAGRDGGLADAPLAGDEQQPSVEEVGHQRTAGIDRSVNR